MNERIEYCLLNFDYSSFVADIDGLSDREIMEYGFKVNKYFAHVYIEGVWMFCPFTIKSIRQYDRVDLIIVRNRKNVKYLLKKYPDDKSFRGSLKRYKRFKKDIKKHGEYFANLKFYQSSRDRGEVDWEIKRREYVKHLEGK